MQEDKPPQPLDYATPERRRTRPAATILIAAMILFAAVFFALAMSWHNGNSNGWSPMAKCASNMHQIGLAILLYQNDHAGAYPNKLEELFEEQITPQVFICPSSNDTPSTGATTQAIAADFHAGGHLSYIYLGKGLSDKTVTDDTVVLYEPLTNHGGSGMSILFGDGSSEWFNATIGQQVITAAATGQRVKIKAGVVSTAPIAVTQPQTK